MPTSIVIRGRTARQRPAFAARTVARVAACTLLVVATARADEIRVITSGAFSTTLREVVPEFERTSRNTVVTASGASMGTTAQASGQPGAFSIAWFLSLNGVRTLQCLRFGIFGGRRAMLR